MITFRPISHNVRELLPLLPDYLEKDKKSYLSYLFGSFASEKERKLSDVDIAVLLKEGIEPLEKQLNLLADFTFILKTDEVDLVILNRAPISLQYTIISEAGILPKEFAEKIRGMAGLRNILVHEYLIIEPAQIYKHLQLVNNFQEYARYIIVYREKVEEERCL
jgi:predicted nucleotidyltransferase